ncbi:hypothetical protein HEK131_18420 [Streptomyces seoulensis]|nr:hypothetical protein HEK131_18420 [Streptomyces seoulensis]
MFTRHATQVSRYERFAAFARSLSVAARPYPPGPPEVGALAEEVCPVTSWHGSGEHTGRHTDRSASCVGFLFTRS